MSVAQVHLRLACFACAADVRKMKVRHGMSFQILQAMLLHVSAVQLDCRDHALLKQLQHPVMLVLMAISF